MDNSTKSGNKDVLYMDLRIVKRRVPKKGNLIAVNRRIRDRIISQINGFIFLSKYFQTNFKIYKGDVFMTRMPEYEGVGSELKDNHFYVALLDSDENNPLIHAVPLKSYIEGQRVENPASDVRIGPIAGVENGTEAMAIINQIRPIDKIRLFSGEIIKNLTNLTAGAKDYQIISVGKKRIFRLNKTQLEKIHQAIIEYNYNGYITH